MRKLLSKNMVLNFFLLFILIIIWTSDIVGDLTTYLTAIITFAMIANSIYIAKVVKGAEDVPKEK